MSLRRKLAAFAIANLLALPFMSGLVNAQVTTNNDRTVVTLDVTSDCSVTIDDYTDGDDVGAYGVIGRGTDLEYHDDDDATPAGDANDGFDAAAPLGLDISDTDDNTFSTQDLATQPDNVITVDDPGTLATIEDGEGYVDLQEYATDNYSAVFDARVNCDNEGGYDLHIMDTFNLLGGGTGVVDCVEDIFAGGNCNNIDRREGLFRIAPDAGTNRVVASATTAAVKSWYILDLPDGDCADGSNTYAANCAPASLDPSSVTPGTDGLQEWSSTDPATTEFGEVGITLLCDADGKAGTLDTGAIDPFTRGLDVVIAGQAFRSEASVTCATTTSGAKEYYGAIPSGVEGEDYDPINGSTNPADYSVMRGPYFVFPDAKNWLGYSGPALATNADNFFEVRASTPDDQNPGTYVATLILSCLPNLTAAEDPDFDGEGIADIN